MKKDLTNLLRSDTPEGWTPEDFKRYLKDTLIELIRLELENLPKEEWERTLKTWAKICAFAKGLLKKSQEERQELYRKYRFDSTMMHVSESVVEKLGIAYSLQLMKEKDSPEKLIKLGLEAVSEDCQEISFMKKFFRV
jgi:HSP90 family molecular chaperone